MWYDTPIPARAPAGGLIDPIDGRHYLGGEFLPFYVPRPMMPQIDEVDYPDFLDFVRQEQVGLARRTFAPRLLRAHQRIDRIKAGLLPPEVRDKPIFVSEDHYVLDGNHRWMAHAMEGSELRAWVIGAGFEAAVNLMFRFPRTYTLATSAERN